MLKQRIIARAVSVVLAALFFAANVAFAHARESNIWRDRRRAMTPASASIVPPLRPPVSLHGKVAGALRSQTVDADADPLARLIAAASPHATIRTIARPPKRRPAKTAVLVQDIHRHDQAQSAIARLFASLSAAGALDLIALEGAAGTLDLHDVIRALPRASRDAAAAFLLDKERISGAVRFAVSAKGPPAAVGIENAPLYQANIDAYLASKETAEGLASYLDAEARRLDADKRILNPRLVRFDRTVEAYRRRDVALPDFVKNLRRHAPLPPALAAYRDAAALESALDFSAVERERAEFLNRIAARLGEREQRNLVRRALAFQSGRLRHATFYAAIAELGRAFAVRLSDYPALAAYVRYLRLADKIDANALFRELETAVAAAYQALAESAAELDVVRRTTRLALLRKLLRFELTRDEWRALKKAAALDSPPEAVARPFFDFYETAEKRDHAMGAAFLEAAEARAARSAAIVAGGFHADVFTKILIDHGWTVISVAPRVTRLEDGGGYLGAFAQERTPLERLAHGERLHLSPPTWTPAIKRLLIFFGLAHGLRTGAVTDPKKSFSEARPGEGFRLLASAKRGPGVDLEIESPAGPIARAHFPFDGNDRFSDWPLVTAPGAWAAVWLSRPLRLFYPGAGIPHIATVGTVFEAALYGLLLMATGIWAPTVAMDLIDFAARNGAMLNIMRAGFEIGALFALSMLWIPLNRWIHLRGFFFHDGRQWRVATARQSVDLPADQRRAYDDANRTAFLSLFGGVAWFAFHDPLATILSTILFHLAGTAWSLHVAARDAAPDAAVPASASPAQTFPYEVSLAIVPDGIIWDVHNGASLPAAVDPDDEFPTVAFGTRNRAELDRIIKRVEEIESTASSSDEILDALAPLPLAPDESPYAATERDDGGNPDLHYGPIERKLRTPDSSLRSTLRAATPLISATAGTLLVAFASPIHGLAAALLGAVIGRYLDRPGPDRRLKWRRVPFAIPFVTAFMAGSVASMLGFGLGTSFFAALAVAFAFEAVLAHPDEITRGDLSWLVLGVGPLTKPSEMRHAARLIREMAENERTRGLFDTETIMDLFTALNANRELPAAAQDDATGALIAVAKSRLWLSDHPTILPIIFAQMTSSSGRARDAAYAFFTEAAAADVGLGLIPADVLSDWLALRFNFLENLDAINDGGSDARSPGRLFLDSAGFHAYAALHRLAHGQKSAETRLRLISTLLLVLQQKAFGAPEAPAYELANVISLLKDVAEDNATDLLLGAIAVGIAESWTPEAVEMLENADEERDDDETYDADDETEYDDEDGWDGEDLAAEEEFEPDMNEDSEGDDDPDAIPPMRLALPPDDPVDPPAFLSEIMDMRSVALFNRTLDLRGLPFRYERSESDGFFRLRATSFFERVESRRNRLQAGLTRFGSHMMGVLRARPVPRAAFRNDIEIILNGANPADRLAAADRLHDRLDDWPLRLSLSPDDVFALIRVLLALDRALAHETDRLDRLERRIGRVIAIATARWSVGLAVVMRLTPALIDEAIDALARTRDAEVAATLTARASDVGFPVWALHHPDIMGSAQNGFLHGRLNVIFWLLRRPATLPEGRRHFRARHYRRLADIAESHPQDLVAKAADRILDLALEPPIAGRERPQWVEIAAETIAAYQAETREPLRQAYGQLARRITERIGGNVSHALARLLIALPHAGRNDHPAADETLESIRRDVNADLRKEGYPFRIRLAGAQKIVKLEPRGVTGFLRRLAGRMPGASGAPRLFTFDPMSPALIAAGLLALPPPIVATLLVSAGLAAAYAVWTRRDRIAAVLREAMETRLPYLRVIPAFQGAIDLHGPERDAIVALRYGDIAVDRGRLRWRPKRRQEELYAAAVAELRAAYPSRESNATAVVPEVTAGMIDHARALGEPARIERAIRDAWSDTAKRERIKANLEPTMGAVTLASLLEEFVSPERRLLDAPGAAARIGAPRLMMKIESDAPVGSFKARNVIQVLHWFSSMTAEERRAIDEIVVESTGNQGRAVGWAVRLLKVLYPADTASLRAVVFTGRGIPDVKKRALRAQGMDVRDEFKDYDDAHEAVRRYKTRAAARGRRVLHVQHGSPWVIAGYATIALEIIDQLRARERSGDLPVGFTETAPIALTIPTGSGGLATGIALALKLYGFPNFRVITVQTPEINAMSRSLDAGRAVSVSFPERTLVDGIEANAEDLTLRGFRNLGLHPVYVSKSGVVAGTRALIRDHGVTHEGAVGLNPAAVAEHPGLFWGVEAVIGIATGRNIGDVELAEILGLEIEGPSESLRPLLESIARSPETIQAIADFHATHADGRLILASDSGTAVLSSPRIGPFGVALSANDDPAATLRAAVAAIPLDKAAPGQTRRIKRSGGSSTLNSVSGPLLANLLGQIDSDGGMLGILATIALGAVYVAVRLVQTHLLYRDVRREFRDRVRSGFSPKRVKKEMIAHDRKVNADDKGPQGRARRRQFARKLNGIARAIERERVREQYRQTGTWPEDVPPPFTLRLRRALANGLGTFRSAVRRTGSIGRSAAPAAKRIGIGIATRFIQVARGWFVSSAGSIGRLARYMWTNARAFKAATVSGLRPRPTRNRIARTAPPIPFAVVPLDEVDVLYPGFTDVHAAAPLSASAWDAVNAAVFAKVDVAPVTTANELFERLSTPDGASRLTRSPLLAPHRAALDRLLSENVMFAVSDRDSPLPGPSPIVNFGNQHRDDEPGVDILVSQRYVDDLIAFLDNPMIGDSRLTPIFDRASFLEAVGLSPKAVQRALEDRFLEGLLRPVDELAGDYPAFLLERPGRTRMRVVDGRPHPVAFMSLSRRLRALLLSYERPGRSWRPPLHRAAVFIRTALGRSPFFGYRRIQSGPGPVSKPRAGALAERLASRRATSLGLHAADRPDGGADRDHVLSVAHLDDVVAFLNDAADGAAAEIPPLSIMVVDEETGAGSRVAETFSLLKGERIVISAREVGAFGFRGATIFGPAVYARLVQNGRFSLADLDRELSRREIAASGREIRIFLPDYLSPSDDRLDARSTLRAAFLVLFGPDGRAVRARRVTDQLWRNARRLLSQA